MDPETMLDAVLNVGVKGGKIVAPLAAAGGARAGTEWFGDVPYHSIGCDCGLHLAQNGAGS